MKKRNDLRRRMISGILSMLMVTSILTAIVAVVADDKTPTIYISGMELRTVMQDTDNDGVGDTPTIQGLVSLSVKGGESTYNGRTVPVDKLKNLSVGLEFNPDYLRPSDWETNVPYKNATTSTATTDRTELTHLFFRTDEDLYWTSDGTTTTPTDPFAWSILTGGLKTSAATVTENNTMTLNLTVEQNLVPNNLEGQGGHVGLLKDEKQTYGNYIELGDKPITLGTLSFYIEKDKVADIIRLFDNTDGIVPGSGGEPSGNRLLRIAQQSGTGDYGMSYYYYIRGARPPWQMVTLNPSSTLNCDLHFDFIDAILDAEVVRKDLTVNAYQAYTDGQISDLARTLQNYADTIRITRASGAVEDVSMRWGDPVGGGMEFTTVDGSTYRFTWDSMATGGYILEKKLDDTTYVPGTYTRDGVYNFTYVPDGGTAQVTDTFTYDRKQGVYSIKQTYAYMEDDPLAGHPVLKLHPVPMEVKLTVTPVELERVEVDRQSLTFLNRVGDIGYTYASLQLAQEARLILNATPGTGVVTPIAGVTPALPVTWTPNLIEDVKVEDTAHAILRHWPLNDDDVTDRVGLAIPDDPTVHQAGYELKTSVARTAIENAYPWLTVREDKYDLTSLRRIVDTDPSVPPLGADQFELRAEPVDADGNLIIEIARRDPDDGNGYLDMGVYDVIDLYQPDGVRIDISWFGDLNAGAFYTPTRLTLPWADNRQGYRITIDTGDRSVGTNAGARESLQRQINLGGWFGAELEEHAGDARTDRILGYSRPRQNIYIESYTAVPESYVAGTSPKAYFDFTGDRAGLLRVYADGTLSTLVTLPDIDTGRGETEAENWVALRYDAVTGAEPGYIRQFKVDRWTAWHDITMTTVSGAIPVTIFGEAVDGDAGEPFAGNYMYSGYGKVENPNDDEKVKVRIQKQEENTPVIDPQDISLTYEQFGDTVTTQTNPKTGIEEVKRVIFDPKNEGYSWQQVVTLTITNLGTEELHGLHIDDLENFSYKYTPTGAVTNVSDGSCFTILSQPAPNLAAGASTTFQISYIPDLKVLDPDEDEIWYEDITLYVRNDSGATLRTFEAELKITREGTYKINLIVRPEDLSMGTAGFVAGVEPVTRMYDGTPVGASYTPGSTVWILTQPVDEYALVPKGPYYLSTEQTAIASEPYLAKDGSPMLDPVSNKPLYKNYLTEYASRNLASGSPTYDTLAGERLYFFTMPEGSVTIYVDYFEPLRSKLRLHDLHAYAWVDDAARTDTSLWSPANERPLREVDGENKDVILFAPGRGDYETIPVPTDPNAKNGNYPVVLFDPQKNEYVVFLEDSDEFCGVSVQLRQLELLWNALEANADIEPTVVMTLDDAAGTQIYNEVGGTKDLNDPTNIKDVNYIHRSMLFAAPTEPGTSKTVRVDVSYNDSSDNYWTGTEGSVTRSYTVRFMRRPKENQGLHSANAGNSPYGMIMNDDSITQKNEAKAAFDQKNRFAFNNDGLTPVKAYTVDNAPMLTNIYWPEAWGSGTNYDKEDSSLFVYIGQPFDEPGVTKIVNSAGELVNTDELKITLTAYPLDTAAATLVDRFNSATPCGPYTLAENLNVAGGVLDEHRIEGTFADIRDLRPGVYTLTYTFPDYVDPTGAGDGTVDQKYLSFTRPLIILAARGDVNADLKVDGTDGDYIHNRMSVPLPIDQLTGSINYPAADKLVYRYRIVDVNNDRNINNIDANLIYRLGIQQAFYLPIDYTNHITVTP